MNQVPFYYYISEYIHYMITDDIINLNKLVIQQQQQQSQHDIYKYYYQHRN